MQFVVATLSDLAANNMPFKNYDEVSGSMSRILVRIKFAFILLCVPVVFGAHASQFDSKVFLPKLVGVKVLYEPMTAQEVLAMDPVCLEIGMGAAVESAWGYPGMTRDQLFEILARPEYAPWALIGPGAPAQWLHHYCWGKVSKSRYFSARDSTKRAQNLKNWRLNMLYCIDWPTEKGINWPFFPLMHKEVAESYFYEQAYQKAIISASKAISLDPRLAQAYVILADSHQKLGNAVKALEVITEGLKQGNQTKALTRRYKELGGKMPYPEPNVKEVITPESVPAEKLLIEPIRPTPAPENRSSAEGAEQATAPQANTDQPSKPVGNPYCRFCP